MITVFDPVSPKESHVFFNTAFLASLHEAFPEEEIIFFSEREHLRLLKDCFDDYGVTINNLSFSTFQGFGHKERGLFQRTSAAKTILDCLNKARRLGARRNILLRVSSSGLLMLKLSANSIFRNLRLTIVFHTHYMVYPRAFRPALIQLAKRATLRYGNTENIQYVVLSPIAHLNTIREFPLLASRLHWVDLPYLFRGKDQDQRVNSHPRFGFIGLGDERKGFPLFLRMAKEVRKKFQDSRFRPDFIGAGNLSCNMHHANQDCLSIPLRYDPVPREEYERLVSTVDYAVLPFTGPFYRYSASGSLMDALSLGKPLIASKIPLFEDLFRRMGDIGYLFEDYREMVDIVTGLVENHPSERYLRQRENIIRERSLFEPGTVARDLRSIIGHGD